MSRALHWVFTVNNYDDAILDHVSSLVGEGGGDVSYCIFGKEVGESGTPHLQGFVSFKTRKRLQQVRTLFGCNPHLEVSRNIEKSIAYCEKDGDVHEFGTRPRKAGTRSDLDAFKADVKAGMLDLRTIRDTHSEVYAKYTRFCLEFIQDNYPQKVMEDHELREWQQSLKTLLDGEPDDRTVNFVVDETGNSGKTWFAHWYARKTENVQVLLPGKKADMAYALDSTIRVLFVDAPRSKQGEFIQYDFLEEVKNGYVFSNKYESRVKTLSKLHVVVLMNECPDMAKLSEDRYNIINV